MSNFKRTIDWDALDEEPSSIKPLPPPDADTEATSDVKPEPKKGATLPATVVNSPSIKSPSKGGARGGNGSASTSLPEDASSPKNTPGDLNDAYFKLPANQTLKGRIEAVLFMTGKALTLAEIAEMITAPVEDVEFALVDLMGDFAMREESSLEIDDTDGYILQVKEEYGDIVNMMMPLEMSAAELRTLSAIAIKAPVLQSELIEWRGASAYDHIAQLLQRKLISKRREGRSYILNVTKNFHEYFKLTADKKDLASLVQLIGKEEGNKGLSDSAESPGELESFED